MKKQNNQRRQTLLLTAIATIFLLGTTVSTFAQSVGAPYGARDPQTCADTTSPTKGAISAAQATIYVICSEEKVYENHLYLVENVKVQVGGSVPDNVNNFLGGDIDPNSPVYPLRASLDEYNCSKVSDITGNAGKNCSVYPRPSAKGYCARTTFGDWKCRLSGSDLDVGKAKHDMPPPQ